MTPTRDVTASMFEVYTNLRNKAFDHTRLVVDGMVVRDS